MNPIIQRKAVGVAGGDTNHEGQLLLAVLADLYPVEFFRIGPQDGRDLDALLVLDGDVAKGLAAAAEGVPALVVGEQPDMPPAAGGELRFGPANVLDECLRSRTMQVGQVNPCGCLKVKAGDAIVASIAGQAVWVARPSGRGVCQIFGGSLPVLRGREFLFQHFNRERFFQLLPLLNFLRQLVQDTDWQAVSRPACLVFDDPSLYRPSYGHLDFRRLAEHAAQHEYYVSVAVIPLDARWVSRRVADTFRFFSPRLSILIHGNNHIKGELLQKDEAPSRALAAQAIRRMERLSQRYGLEVPSIMEPPHGAIAEAALPHLLALGYEAALGTPELMLKHNPAPAWPAGFGLARSAVLGGGFPVIPRIMTSPLWRNDVLLAAFLRQPIVVVGHHWDLADGYDHVAEVAELINSLKGVTWTSPSGIARSNFTQLRRAGELHVQTFSRRIQLTPPPGTTSLHLHRPWLSPGGAEELILRQAGREILRTSGPAIVGPIPSPAAGAIEFCSLAPHPIDPHTVPAPRFRVWQVLRKVLMEVRDRSAPLRYGVQKRWRPRPAELGESAASGEPCLVQGEQPR